MNRSHRSPSLVVLGALSGVAPLVAAAVAAVIAVRHFMTQETSRLLRWSDLLWLLAAGALGASVAVASGPMPAVRIGTWILAGWLLFRAFEALRDRTPVSGHAALLDGMSIALSVITALSITRLVTAGTEASGVASILFSPLASDTQLAHSALVVSGLTAVLARGRPWRVLFALAAGSIAIAATGRLEALIGVATISAAIVDLDRRAVLRPARNALGIVSGVVAFATVTAAIGLQQLESNDTPSSSPAPPAMVITGSPGLGALTFTTSAWIGGEASVGRSESPASRRVRASPDATPRAATAQAPMLLAATAWRNAWRSFSERPLVGTGRAASAIVPGNFASDQVQARSAPPGLLTTTVLQHGLVGLLGLVALLGALFGHAIQRRDARLLAVALALLIVNAFDATLLSTGVLFPLAAVAGWRRPHAARETSIASSTARKALVVVALAITEVFVAVVALVLVARMHAWWGANLTMSKTLFASIALWPILSWRSGMFPGYGLTPAQELRNHASTAFYVAVLCGLGLFFVPALASIPVAALLTVIGTTALLQPAGRAVAKRVLLVLRLWGRPVVILGAGEMGRRLARSLGRTRLDGLHPVAFFDDDVRLHGKRLEGLRVRGAIDDAYGFGARHRIRHAIVTLPELNRERLDQLVTGSGRVYRRVQFVPDLTGLPTNDVIATDLDGNLALEVRNGLFHPINRTAKRAADIALGSLLLVLLAPFLALLWLLIRLDSHGGGFHHSARVGEDGQPFHCLKFRTMFEDAEERLEALLASEPALREEYELWHKLEDDPRVTRVGLLLRRTSLDELPQLWNVVTGQMSLVGPRPYLAREVPAMGHRGQIIHHAKPGMTGFWQIHGRSSVTFEDRLDMEAHYVRNWSVWWDLILLVQTPWALAQIKNGAK